MCAPPNPRLITGIGAISAARRSFHLTMLDEPTKSTWQGAGGAARSASTKRAISGAKSSSVAEIGPGAVWASVTAANSAIATADKAKQRIRRRYVAMMFPPLSRSVIWNRASLAYSYDLPFGRGKRWLNQGLASAFFGGWALNGV